MRARLLYMKPEVRRQLGVYLWQVFEIIEVKIYENGWKYPRQSKQVICKNGTRQTMFYWYEVELIN